MPTMHRYSISNRKRLIDFEPAKRGESPLVWLKDRHEWIELDLASGEHADCVPITDEEAQRICEAGEIPERINQYLRLGISDAEEQIRNGLPLLGEDGEDKKTGNR